MDMKYEITAEYPNGTRLNRTVKDANIACSIIMVVIALEDGWNLTVERIKENGDNK